MNGDMITVVSGLPRSGTSMMMKMLEAGGMRVFTDSLRRPDEDNPNGYYEFERVKKLEVDQSWLEEAKGQVVKVISRLLVFLPASFYYKVIFMERRMEEILASQNQMLMRRGKPTDTISDERMAELFEKHLQKVKSWIAHQPNIDVLYVSYNDMLREPAVRISRINQFLDNTLIEEKMAAVIDKALYRQRS